MKIWKIVIKGEGLSLVYFDQKKEPCRQILRNFINEAPHNGEMKFVDWQDNKHFEYGIVLIETLIFCSFCIIYVDESDVERMEEMNLNRGVPN